MGSLGRFTTSAHSVWQSALCGCPLGLGGVLVPRFGVTVVRREHTCGGVSSVERLRDTLSMASDVHLFAQRAATSTATRAPRFTSRGRPRPQAWQRCPKILGQYAQQHPLQQQPLNINNNVFFADGFLVDSIIIDPNDLPPALADAPGRAFTRAAPSRLRTGLRQAQQAWATWRYEHRLVPA